MGHPWLPDAEEDLRYKEARPGCYSPPGLGQAMAAVGVEDVGQAALEFEGKGR